MTKTKILHDYKMIKYQKESKETKETKHTWNNQNDKSTLFLAYFGYADWRACVPRKNGTRVRAYAAYDRGTRVRRHGC